MTPTPKALAEAARALKYMAGTDVLNAADLSTVAAWLETQGWRLIDDTVRDGRKWLLAIPIAGDAKKNGYVCKFGFFHAETQDWFEDEDDVEGESPLYIPDYYIDIARIPEAPSPESTDAP